MKVGDLVRLPEDDGFWWANRVGLVVHVQRSLVNSVSENSVARVLVGKTYTKFAIRFLKVAEMEED